MADHAIFLADENILLDMCQTRKVKHITWNERTPHSRKLTIHHIFLCNVTDGDKGGNSNRYHE